MNTADTIKVKFAEVLMREKFSYNGLLFSKIDENRGLNPKIGTMHFNGNEIVTVIRENK